MFTESSDALAARIKRAAEAANQAPSTFCHRNFGGDGRLYERLTNGGSCTLKTYQKVIDLIGPPQKASA
jgi:hypothetical protein